MGTKQLYAGGTIIYPETRYEQDKAAEKISALETQISSLLEQSTGRLISIDTIGYPTELLQEYGTIQYAVIDYHVGDVDWDIKKTTVPIPAGEVNVSEIRFSAILFGKSKSAIATLYIIIGNYGREASYEIISEDSSIHIDEVLIRLI